jgi:hypothetical protein
MSDNHPVVHVINPPQWQVHECLNDGVKSKKFWVVVRDTRVPGPLQYECEDRTKVRFLAHGIPHRTEQAAIERAAALNNEVDPQKRS